MKNGEKAYLDMYDIAARYGCGTSKAYSYIRAIRAYNGGGALSAGKVLLSEVEYWEQRRGGQEPREEKGD